MPGTKAIEMLVIIIINTNKLPKVSCNNRRQNSVCPWRMEKCICLFLGIVLNQNCKERYVIYTFNLHMWITYQNT